MPYPLPYFPYPPAGDGFWSPITATLNWCEEVDVELAFVVTRSAKSTQDYYATIYTAELINTLTNIYFIYLAIKGIRNCRQNNHDSACQVAFFNMLFIGTGSIFFHTTLNCKIRSRMYFQKLNFCQIGCSFWMNYP